MSEACDPKGCCPRCGYENGPGAVRCVRCRTALRVMQGCSGACSKCLVQSERKQEK